MPDYEAADRAFLKKAASIIRSRLRFRSPSDEAAASWNLNARGPVVYVRSYDLGVVATNANTRHPLFGDREHWYNTNQNHPKRTGWTSRAVREAIDQAAQDGTDEWLRGVTITSKYFNYSG